MSVTGKEKKNTRKMFFLVKTKAVLLNDKF